MTVSELLKMCGWRRCNHEEVRCIHGDEIVARAYTPLPSLAGWLTGDVGGIWGPVSQTDDMTDLTD